MIGWKQLDKAKREELYLLVEELKEGTLVPEKECQGLFFPDYKKETPIDPLIESMRKYIKRTNLVRTEISDFSKYERKINEKIDGIHVLLLPYGFYSKNFAVFIKKYVNHFNLITSGFDLYFYDEEERKFSISQPFNTLYYESIHIFKRRKDEIPKGVKAKHVTIMTNPYEFILSSNGRMWIGKSLEGFLMEIPPLYMIMRSPRDEIYCVKVFHDNHHNKNVAYVRPGNVEIKGSELLGIIQPRWDENDKMSLEEIVNKLVGPEITEAKIRIVTSKEYINSSRECNKYLLALP